MGKYIKVKKSTARCGCLSGLVVLAVCLACWLCLLLFKGGETAQMVETASHNELCVDGKAVAYFRGIASDSTLTGLSLHADSVHVSERLDRFSGRRLHLAVTKTRKRLAQELKLMEASRAETDYFLGVHNVQDEGYDMIAQLATSLQTQITEHKRLLAALDESLSHPKTIVRRIATKTLETETTPSSVFVNAMGGQWRWGRWSKAARSGSGVSMLDSGRTVVCGQWDGDTIVAGRAVSESGTYVGQMNRNLMASGHGCFIDTAGVYYEGRWSDGQREGFGFSLDGRRLRVGEWRSDKYLGERMHYTSERIYGIDISRYQHGRGRKYYPIHWNQLRITNLGSISRKTVRGKVDYPVSFVYIKSTEGTSIRNRYFKSDYNQAHRYKIKTGAYHFYSVRSTAKMQAEYFLKNTTFRHGDMPPVLDVEPTDQQIEQMGGAGALFRSIRTWLEIVRQRVGVRPVLYVSQRFVNKYLKQAPDIKRDYNVWIARYGEYKPDVRLVFWQLCPDGRVKGITGAVDINVFNGYRDKFDEFVTSETVR